MTTPWDSGDLALQASQGERFSFLSTLAHGSIPQSTGNVMDPEAIMEQAKRKPQKLPTGSLMAMTCGIGG
jgi:hypothetical protein